MVLSDNGSAVRLSLVKLGVPTVGPQGHANGQRQQRATIDFGKPPLTCR